MYTPTGAGVKEDLVLKSASSPTSFTFVIADPRDLLGRATRTFGEGWQFSRRLQDGARLALSAPAAWEQSRKTVVGGSVGQVTAHQRLTRIRGGFSVTLSVDRSWLRGKSFPIVLDPSLVFDYPDSTISTAFAPVGASDCPDASPCPLSTQLDVNGNPLSDVDVTARYLYFNGAQEVLVPEMRAYYHIDLSTLVGNNQVTSAIFRVGEGNQGDDEPHPELDLHAVKALMTSANTGVDLVNAEDPALMAHLDPRPVGYFPCVIAELASNPKPCEEADFDITNQVNRWIGQGASTAAAAGWALQTTADNITEFFYAPEVDITYQGDPVPAPIPVSQSFGCDCRWSHGAALSRATGDPVKSNIGASLETATDLTTPAPGIPAVLTRTYNGADAALSPLGVGWTDSFAITATQDPVSGSVSVRDGSGGVSTFVPQTGGSYTPGIGVVGSLTARTGGGWTLATPRGEILTFDAAGQVLTDKDAQGHGLTYTYSGSQLVGVTDALGQVTTLTYGGSGAGSGLLTAATTASGQNVTYGYSTIAGTAHLTSVTGVDGTTTTLSYDSNGVLNGITDPDSHTSARNIIDPLSGRITSQTDAAGEVTTFAWDPATNTATTTDPMGRVTRDVYNGDGAGGEGNVLIDHFDANGGRTHYSYDNSLNVVAITDPTGAATSMTYDSAGDMLTRTAPAPLNYTETWTYDANHHVLTHTDARGHTTTNSYNASGQLVTVTAPDGGITRYTYTTLGQVATVKDARAHTTTNTYNTAGDLVSVKDGAGAITTYTYDTAHHQLTRTDPRGNVTGANPATYTTTFTYDPAGRILTQTDPLGRTTTYRYDAAGNRITVTDPTGAVTTTTYDADNRPLTVTDPDGHVTTNAYDADGEVISLTDPSGAVTAYGYDPDGNRTTVTRPDGTVPGASAATRAAYTTTTAYDADDRPVSQTQPDPTNPGSMLTTTTGYDALGRAFLVTDPAGDVTETGYDQDGNTISVTDANGNASTTSYDSMNRPVSLTDRDGNTTTNTYDPTGNMLSSTDGVGNTTTWTYDPDNRKITQVDPRGNVAGANPTTYRTSYAYDKAGNLTKTTDPLAHAVVSTFDADNEITAVTDPRGKKTSYTFDADGRTHTITTAVNAVTTYTYDPAGFLTGTSNPLSQTTTNTYDAAGRLLTSATGAGQITAYTYDPDGNTLTTALPSGTATPTAGDGTMTATYDALDRRTGLSYSDGTPSIAYTYTPAGQIATITDGQPGTLTYRYDAAGRITGISRVTGTTSTGFSYSLDPNGNTEYRSYPDHTLVQATYDPDNRLLTLGWPAATGGSSTTTFGYDPAGNPVSRSTTTGASTVSAVTTFDPAGRATGVTNTSGTGAGATAISAFTQTLDADADPTLITSTRGGVSSTAGYGYDNADRLTSWCPVVAAGALTCTGAPAVTTYTLDKDGNRTKAVTTGSASATSTNTYNSQDQLIKSVTTGVGAGTTTDGYDPNGDLTTRTGPGGSSTFAYNLAHQLTGATTPAGTVTYSYDGLGNRATGSTATATTNYQWDLNAALPQLAETTTGAGAVLTRYLSADGTTLAQNTTAGDSLLLNDLQTNTSDLTDPSGAILGTWTYTPDGAVTSSTGTDPRVAGTTELFAGQYLDTSTGLYNDRARQYEPSTGRFTTPDAHTPTPLTSTYIYADDNPLAFHDPSGLDCGWNPFSSDASTADCGWENSVANWLSGGDNDNLIANTVNSASNTLVNLGRGATGGITDNLDNSVSSGSSDMVDATSWNARLAQGLGAVSAYVILPNAGSACEAAEGGGMAGVRAAGQTGEDLASIVKNTDHIPSASGTAAYRIPDELNASTLGEVKNVSSLSYTNQLRDFQAYAQSTGRTFNLYVRGSTTFSGPLQDAINAGQINVIRNLPG